MHSIRRLAVVAIAVAAVAAGGPALAQQKLKWAHVYETSEPYHTESVWAAAEIKKRTNGKFDIEVFPASSLGKETDINQGMSLAQVKAANPTLGYRSQYGTDSGPWTTDMFVEVIYNELAANRKKGK